MLVTHDIDNLYLADRIVALGGRPASVTREKNMTHITKEPGDWLYKQSDPQGDSADFTK